MIAKSLHCITVPQITLVTSSKVTVVDFILHSKRFYGGSGFYKAVTLHLGRKSKSNKDEERDKYKRYREMKK